MKNSVRKLAFSAVIGATYFALTIGTGFMSYGVLQFRMAEVLNILPFFFPETAWGLWIGCFLSNLMSGFGIYDLLFGSLATLASALLIAFFGKKYRRKKWAMLLSCLIPAIINGAVVGFVIAVTSVPNEFLWRMTAIYGAQIGLGELAVMTVLGVPAMFWFSKSHLFGEIYHRLYEERKE